MQPLFIITNKQMDKTKPKTKFAPIDEKGVYIEEYDDDDGVSFYLIKTIIKHS